MALTIHHIKATNLELTDKLRTTVTQKLSVLEKYTAHHDEVTCDVELERITGKQSGDIFRAEANFRMGGKLYRAEATTDQIEKSIDEVEDELDAELRKARDKSHTLFKRGGAAIKRMMQFGK